MVLDRSQDVPDTENVSSLKQVEVIQEVSKNMTPQILYSQDSKLCPNLAIMSISGDLFIKEDQYIGHSIIAVHFGVD